MATAEVTVARALIDTQTGGGINYVVRTAAGDLYIVYIDAATSDVMFKKSTDGGFTWSTPTTIFTGAATQLSIWYDRWSNISAGLIHCAYTESGGDDTLYRTIDTENSDTLSTQRTIFLGMSTAGSSMLSITRARGGNVYCNVTIDGGVEGGFARLLNADVPSADAWAARSSSESGRRQPRHHDDLLGLKRQRTQSLPARRQRQLMGRNIHFRFNDRFGVNRRVPELCRRRRYYQ
jgi:hypothetical protein